MKKKIVVQSSWDDGTINDFRLARLLKKYKIPAIFYIPNKTNLTDANIKMLAEDFEIGGHTVNHVEDLKVLSDAEARKEIVDNKKWLEKLIGKKIKSFCYPSGRFDDRIVGFVKEASYKEARTVAVLNTEMPKDKFRIQPTIHVYDNRKEYQGRKWSYMAMTLFDKIIRDGGYFHIWGHSEEINRGSLWWDLENFFEYLNKKLTETGYSR